MAVGDWVLSIDGENAGGLTHIEAQNKIRACGERLSLGLSRYKGPGLPGGWGTPRPGLLLPLLLLLQGPAGSEQTAEGRPRTSERNIWAVGGVGLDC